MFLKTPTHLFISSLRTLYIDVYFFIIFNLIFLWDFKIFSCPKLFSPKLGVKIECDISRALVLVINTNTNNICYRLYTEYPASSGFSRPDLRSVAYGLEKPLLAGYIQRDLITINYNKI